MNKSNFKKRVAIIKASLSQRKLINFSRFCFNSLFWLTLVTVWSHLRRKDAIEEIAISHWFVGMPVKLYQDYSLI